MAAIDDANAAEAALVAAVTGPQRVSSDAGSVEQFKPSELIAAARYLAAVASATLRRRGLRANKFIPAGTVERRAGELGGGDGNAGGWGISGGFPG